MHFIIAGISIIAGVYYFVLRARMAARVADDLVNVVGDTRLALRRGRFKSKANVHPAETIEHGDEAIAGIAAAFAELDGMASQNTLDTLTRGIARHLGVTLGEAEELQSFGRWISAQCGTPNAAILRLSRKLNRLEGGNGASRLMNILKDVIGHDAISDRQREALQDIARQLSLR